MVVMNHRWLNPAKLRERGRAFPNATFLMGHMLWDYADFAPVLRECDNVFLTTTSSHRFRGIEEMVRQVGGSKLVFGSDASYHELAFGLGTIAFARISDQEKRQILGLNMRAIMQAGIRNLPGVVIIGGGLVVEAGGSLVGAIGVSGAPGGDADEACAKAGTEAIKDKLARIDRNRLARECAKLDPKAEQALAEEGIIQELDEWPEY